MGHPLSFEKEKPKRLGLVLSGGGTRALLYHLGVLRWLAERRLMSTLSEVSSVSGGSWCVGCVLGHADGKWPTDDEYLDRVLPSIRSTLTCSSMLRQLVVEALKRPWLLFRRFELFAEVFSKHWGLKGFLDEISGYPRLHINATTFETGKRWSFSQTAMGDYIFGYSDRPHIPVSVAVAASSGFPLFVGPVQLDTRKFEWRNGPYSSNAEEVRTRYPLVHLWDGGVYENTGLEPLFKSGELRNGIDFLVVADAAEPFALAERSWWLTRAIRLLLIAMDQVRSLRARQVVRAFDRNHNGFYAKIGKSPLQHLRDLGLRQEPWFKGPLDQSDCDRLAKFTIYPTRVSPDDFDALTMHAWQTCESIYGALYEHGSRPTTEFVSDPVGKSIAE